MLKIILYAAVVIAVSSYIQPRCSVPSEDPLPDASHPLAGTSLYNNISHEDLYKRVSDYLRDETLSPGSTLHKPSPTLISRADQSQTDTPQQPIAWIREASTNKRKGLLVEAANLIIEGISTDRTLLACFFSEIDTFAFPLAQQLLEVGHVADAHKLLSACGVASGMPVAYLRELMKRLSPEQAGMLWDNEPYLVLVDFGKEENDWLHVNADFQYRDPFEWHDDPAPGYKSDSSVRIDAGPSEQTGVLSLGWHEKFMMLTPGESGIRVYVRVEKPEPVEVTMHGVAVFRSDITRERFVRLPVPDVREDGWLCFDSASMGNDIWSNLLHQIGWPARGIVTTLDEEEIANTQVYLKSVGLDFPPGKANTYWLCSIELYLPEGSWETEPQIPSPSQFKWGWGLITPDRFAGELSDEEQESLEQLGAMGYVGASMPSPVTSGVVVHNPEKASPGYNFYVSGHELEVLLMDMNGDVAHSWRCRFDSPLWPEDILPARIAKHHHWRRAHLFPNGDVLALACGLVFLRMDKDGNLIWAKTGGYHHDFHVLEDGTIYVLYHQWESHPLAGFGNETLVDYIMVLDETGNELRRVSLLKALENSFYAPILYGSNYVGDIMHTNTLQVLDGSISDRLPSFRAGNVLVCINRLSLVAVVDLDKEEVVWGQTGQWLFPHESHVTRNNTMLIFDNHGPYWNINNRPMSRVLEFDPLTREVLWEYTGSREHPLYSSMIGAVTLMPNDNILITEGVDGRVFEVTRDKEIVWEFLNPARGGEHDELIASIFDMLRIPEEYVAAWLE